MRGMKGPNADALHLPLPRRLHDGGPQKGVHLHTDLHHADVRRPDPQVPSEVGLVRKGIKKGGNGAHAHVSTGSRNALQASFVPEVETKLLPAYSMKMPAPPHGLETRGQRLRWARETFQRQSGERLSARAFAMEHEVAVPTYSTHEKDGEPGGRKFSEEDAERYARILGVDAVWLHKGKPRPKRTDTVSIVGLVGLGDQIQWTEEGDLSLGEVELPFVVANDCFGLEARGASQYPRVKDGEIVIARWLSDMPEHYIGREVVLKTEDGTYLLKTLKRHDGDGHFTIGSHNAPDVENVPIEKVAEVVSIVPQHQWRRIG